MIKLLPRDEKFFDELEGLANHVRTSAQELDSVTKDFPNFDGHLETIEKQRLDARDILKSSLVRLDKAFITPLDRDDILGLLGELYGVVDRVAELSQRFRLYRLRELYPTLSKQSRNLNILAAELQEIIFGLRQQKKLSDAKSRLDIISEMMENVKRDREEFLGSLFSENVDPIEVIKKKELHELLEEAIERCEIASETVARVLLKNG